MTLAGPWKAEVRRRFSASWPISPIRQPLDSSRVLRCRRLELVGDAGEHGSQSRGERAADGEDDEHHHAGDERVFQRDHGLQVAAKGHPPRRARFPASDHGSDDGRGAGQRWFQGLVFRRPDARQHIPGYESVSGRAAFDTIRPRVPGRIARHRVVVWWRWAGDGRTAAAPPCRCRRSVRIRR